MKLSQEKSLRKILFLGIILILSSVFWGCASSETQIPEEPGYVSDYPELDGYGRWLTVPPYGEVWQPYVIDNWQPFSYGNWVWTDQGWAWVSYEPYGWLVFHYGYWDYDPSVGWFWIPGDQWSPARVRWIEYGDYIGWAPLPPHNVVWPEPWERSRIHIWVVVNRNKFLDDDIGRHRIAGFPRREPQRIVIRDREPDVRIIERSVNHPVPQTRIQREPVRFRDHEFQRMQLPPEERNRIEQRREETRREILRPAPKQVPRERKQEGKEEKAQPQKKQQERHIERRESGEKEQKHRK